MKTTEDRRLFQLEHCIPDIWKFDDYLYVGANLKRFHFKDKLWYVATQNPRGSVDVVEIDFHNVKELSDEDNYRWINHIFYNDFKDFLELGLHKYHYDVIIWSHGPSCLKSEHDVIQALKRMKEDSGVDLAVTMCPFGKYHGGDPDDPSSNKIALYPDIFLHCGYNVNIDGEKDTNGSNLLAWYRRK